MSQDKRDPLRHEAGGPHRAADRRDARSLTDVAVNLRPSGRLLPVGGISLGTACAGIRKRDRDDLTLLTVAAGSSVAGLFTLSRCPAAPVQVCRRHLRPGADIRALVVNSGIANAGTGPRGIASALEVCAIVARLLGCRRDQVLPFSTGVISEQLPVAGFGKALAECVSGIGPRNWPRAARAIMTTDTTRKGLSMSVPVGDGRATVTGIAKGSGMIHPNMATMLSYLATDASIPQQRLDAVLREAVSSTFNSISVDSETSTNDSVVAIATGAALGRSALSSRDLRRVADAIGEVAERLAVAIVRDGKGAAKLITVNVRGLDSPSCRKVADSIATSPLVKIAFSVNNADIGRLLMAIGKADAPLRQQDVCAAINGLPVIRGGEVAPDYDKRKVARQVRRREVTVDVTIGRKAGSARVRTCDLGEEYFRAFSASGRIARP